ncbi:MAG: hypothetical protein RBR24_05065, partial [Candidatus Carbobacillus sp.]|nr:hypothetical protein [Candidatus Carbobacillus sp.]
LIPGAKATPPQQGMPPGRFGGTFGLGPTPRRALPPTHTPGWRAPLGAPHNPSGSFGQVPSPPTKGGGLFNLGALGRGLGGGGTGGGNTPLNWLELMNTLKNVDVSKVTQGLNTIRTAMDNVQKIAQTINQLGTVAGNVQKALSAIDIEGLLGLLSGGLGDLGGTADDATTQDNPSTQKSARKKSSKTKKKSTSRRKKNVPSSPKKSPNHDRSKKKRSKMTG